MDLEAVEGALRVRDDGRVPARRYTSTVFATLEFEHLWSRVWQVACREEEVAAPGDHVEYTIGDRSILVIRSGDGSIGAFLNACVHRGTRLAAGCGHFDADTFRCRYHGWAYDFAGRVVDVPDRADFEPLPPDLGLAPVRAESWGGFVFVNLDLGAVPLLDFLDPIPTLLAPYHLDRMRFRRYQSMILPANWKAVVDAFNEGYHVQGSHPQVLPWTDDTSLAYEQFGTHARYGRLPGARRELKPSARLGLAEDGYDEGEILSGLVAGLGGAFLADERALVDELRATGPPPGTTLLGAYQARRRALLEARGVDVSGLDDARLTSAEDVYWFPNLVGPIYPGSALFFRVRPNGLDPHSAVKDVWTLESPAPGVPAAMPERRFYADWTERDWGVIANQDYANLGEVQAGMRAAGDAALRLSPRQEGNILQMHRVLDRYLFEPPRERAVRT